MQDFRDPKFIERYEDVSFQLDTPIVTTIANNASQNKKEYRFSANNTGELTPFDWYNSRIYVNFKVVKTADGTAIAANDGAGIVNGSASLINKLKVVGNGKTLYDCDNANRAINIKNLVDYSQAFSKGMGTNQFFFLDTNRSADERRAEDTFNNGFAARKALLGTSNDVSTEIPLNRYSFFQGLKRKILPNMKIDLVFDLESDSNLIWRRGGADCRVVVTSMRLFVPRIIFTTEGNELYKENYMRPQKWSYLREQVYQSQSSQQKTGEYRITNAINKPRDVFVWIENSANQDDQTKNPFLLDTFNVANDRTLDFCELVVANGNKYPEEDEYNPSAEIARVFRDIHKYSYSENGYDGTDTVLNRANFETIFPFIYFDLRNQRMDLKDGATRLVFKYKLSGETNANYTIRALVLYEQDVELFNMTGKLMVR